MLKGRLLGSVTFASTLFVIKVSSASAQTTTDKGGNSNGIIALIIYIAICIIIGYFMWRNRRPFSLQHQTAVAADQIVMTAVQQYTMKGWAVTSQTPMNVTLERRLQGSCFLALPLLLLGIIPGILYLRSRNKIMVSSVHVSPGATGSVVSIRGNLRGFGGESAAKKLVQQLP